MVIKPKRGKTFQQVVTFNFDEEHQKKQCVKLNFEATHWVIKDQKGRPLLTSADVRGTKFTLDFTTGSHALKSMVLIIDPDPGK